MIKIGEFSRMVRVSIKALRHYDEIGLLRPAFLDHQTGYRYYSIKQLPLLNRLLVYRKLGFSLEQSRVLLQDDVGTDRMRDLLKARRAELAAAIEAQREQLIEVETRISEIEREGHPPPYEVLIKSIGPRPVATLRRTVSSYDAVDALINEIKLNMRKGAGVSGYGAIWHRCIRTHSVIDCEAFALTEQLEASRNGLTAYQLPASPMACIVHDLHENDAPIVYYAAVERAEAMGYEVCGPMHEIYFPTEGTEFAVTEVQFPIRRAAASAQCSTK